MIKPRRGGEDVLQGQLSRCTTRSCITSFFCLQEAQSFSVYIFVKIALQLGLRRNPIYRFLSSHTVTYFDASTKAQHMKMGQLYNHQAPLSTGQRCPRPARSPPRCSLMPSQEDYGTATKPASLLIS